MDKFSLFVLNIFVNSFLAFFTAAILTEGVIFIYRIRQGRFAAILRMIPILKLPFDLFLYDFSRWCYSHGVNPLTCEEDSRRLSVMFTYVTSIPDQFFLPIASGIQFTAPGNTTFTIADMIGHSIKPGILSYAALIFLALCMGILIRKLIMYWRFVTSLHLQVQVSQCENRKVRNSALMDYLKKGRLKIVTTSSLAGSPFVIGLISPIAYIPLSLSKNLSRKEYEAALAHEMEHIRHKDGLVRLILDFIGSVFWWVPTKWLQKRIEEGQEVGCDLKCRSYGVNPIDLASAICKSAKESLHASQLAFAHHLAKRTIQRRIHLLLKAAPVRFGKKHFLFSCLAAGIAFMVVFLGRFWTF